MDNDLFNTMIHDVIYTKLPKNKGYQSLRNLLLHPWSKFSRHENAQYPRIQGHTHVYFNDLKKTQIQSDGKVIDSLIFLATPDFYMIEDDLDRGIL